jgi:hypothetical protein
MYNKTVIEFGFCDTNLAFGWNDNTYLHLDNSGHKKPSSNNC